MKRKSATKLTALMLTGVMTAGLLAGCGNKDGNSTPADGDAQQGGQEQNEAAARRIMPEAAGKTRPRGIRMT